MNSRSYQKGNKPRPLWSQQPLGC